ncbi:hypothetical protein [Pseudonocardia spinosispora]|uniref:hypothetical protein n=1 Tax=Pseudonocardia spinosispora TaxID=103441 RepID=UPI0003FD1AA9|nr:hypothetical protein [Pseudonocardia spinosispora]
MSQERAEPSIPSSVPPSMSQPPTSLSARINRLFEVVRPPDSPEREYRNRDVAKACRNAGKEGLSEGHLGELRRGIKTNPTLRTLQTIAWFFEVPVGYFSDPDTAEQVELELALREAKRNAKLESERKALEERAEAMRHLTMVARKSGVLNMAHRGLGGEMGIREQTAMLVATAKLIAQDDDDEDEDQDD